MGPGTFATLRPTMGRPSIGPARRGDLMLVWLLRAVAVVTGAIVVLIVGFLAIEAVPFIAKIGILRFFTDASWNPTAELYNMTPMLAGTLLVSAGAMALAMLFGMLAAVFCRFYAPPVVATLFRRITELLAGVPSVVYGFWGLVVIVPNLNALHPPGASLLAGILVLTVMIVPTIAMTADAAFSAVPRALTDGARALGLGNWGILRLAILPAARSGLLTGVILQTGRALGETMAVLMVCGNIVQVPGSLFDPVRTLTANIALEMAYAMDDHRSALFVSGLLLMVVVAALVVAATLTPKLGGSGD